MPVGLTLARTVAPTGFSEFELRYSSEKVLGARKIANIEHTIPHFPQHLKANEVGSLFAR